MTPHDKSLHFIAPPPTWHEELFRSTKYEEAAQKRKEEKKARRKQAEVEAKAEERRLSTGG